MSLKLHRNQLWNWTRLSLFLGVVATGILWWRGDSTAVNVGFLIVGGTLTALVTLAIERARRDSLVLDLASALYIELADRAARCCFDYESPWREYVDMPVAMTVLRLRKFVPLKPVIYLSCASQLPTLEEYAPDAPQQLIQFYFRLEAWRRDAENVADSSDRQNHNVRVEATEFLARRLGQTLVPALAALKSLSPLVQRHLELDANAIAPYDAESNVPRSKELLRQRMLAVAPLAPR